MLQERQGDWMQTATGRTFWPIDPHPDDVCIEDIAHALSLMCRYGGHCKTFYSVAQHSVLVARALPREYRAWGLLHDASEAYIVDVPRPLKPYLLGYRAAEDKVTKAIARHFNLPLPIPSEVKRVDNAILADEAAQIMSKPPQDWHLPEPPLGIRITPWSPEEAKTEFMIEFNEIKNGKSA